MFIEAQDSGSSPQGVVEVMLKAEIKTHLKDHYLLEKAGTYHGEPRYPMLVNIDGQAATWEVEGKKESAPNYIDKSVKRNPERGEGMKYSLSKRIWLSPGSHRVFFGLPGDRVSKEVVITVEEGKPSVLEFKPVYRRYRTQGSIFTRGVSRLKAFWNGTLLP
ncbi:MAG: hypothetical protein K8I29_05530 [Alphaproteobacteria bacterium]|uniref:Uncharacterized protein n=1 Tax=Candidatus Nitrobium versatile TaxID=2884831 RepID=A0A953J991_9BACT|nr:hypothetical protein [Candidatus Nitrobium versatile]